MLGHTMTQVTGELALIERIRSKWSGGKGRVARGVALGIGDDCAILRPGRGREVLVTTDFTLEGRHFRREWHPAQSVGHRALARGLSDLAAMGAQPMAAFLSLGLPAEMAKTAAGRRWVDGFFEGLDALARRFKVLLAGGDTSESPNGLVLADIVLVGTAPVGRSLRRSGARAGDFLYVTGALGGAAAELAEMRAVGRRRTVRAGGAHPQMFPEPRLKVGQALLRRGLATAAMDISDGISTDLTHLCVESGVGAEVDVEGLPIHQLARRAGDGGKALELALHGGEDYELLFTARPGKKVPKRIAGVEVTRIGRVTPGKAVELIARDGRRERLRPGGWEHFRHK